MSARERSLSAAHPLICSAGVGVGGCGCGVGVGVIW